jgi:hypothetical protein
MHLNTEAKPAFETSCFNCTLPMDKDQKRKGLQLYSFFNLSAKWGCDEHHAPATLPPEKDSRYPLYRGVDGPIAGLDGCGKYRHHRDSIPGPPSP